MESNELYRLLLNLVRKGRVIAVDHAKEVVRVRSGDIETNWVRWLAIAAGDTREWAPPSLNEQVLLLAPGGDLAAAVAVRGIYAEDTPPPSHAPGVHSRRYPDGTLVEYDTEAHTLTATLASSGAVIVKAETVNVQSKTATVKADTVTLDAQKTTCTGDLDVGGAIKAGGNVNAGGDVKAGAISLTSHKHMVISIGSPTGVSQP